MAGSKHKNNAQKKDKGEDEKGGSEEKTEGSSSVKRKPAGTLDGVVAAASRVSRKKFKCKRESLLQICCLDCS